MKITLKSFATSSRFPESLVRAVVRQVGTWTDFKSIASDVASYGAQGGFSGFTWYEDTVKFTSKNLDAIMLICRQDAEEFGISGVISFIKAFNGMQDYSEDEIAEGIYDKHSDMRTTIFNVLAWYVLEEVARAYVSNVDFEESN